MGIFLIWVCLGAFAATFASAILAISPAWGILAVGALAWLTDWDARLREEHSSERRANDEGYFEGYEQGFRDGEDAG